MNACKILCITKKVSITKSKENVKNLKTKFQEPYRSITESSYRNKSLPHLITRQNLNTEEVDLDKIIKNKHLNFNDEISSKVTYVDNFKL